MKKLVNFLLGGLFVLGMSCTEKEKAPVNLQFTNYSADTISLFTGCGSGFNLNPKESYLRKDGPGQTRLLGCNYTAHKIKNDSCFFLKEGIVELQNNFY